MSDELIKEHYEKECRIIVLQNTLQKVEKLLNDSDMAYRNGWIKESLDLIREQLKEGK